MKAGSHTHECVVKGCVHFFGQNSVKREVPDASIRDESMALAMVEERSDADGASQLTEF